MLRIIKKKVWIDESSCRNGYLNLHNQYSWQLENAHIMRENRFRTNFKIKLWTGVINGNVIGPYELLTTLTLDIYHDFFTKLVSWSVGKRTFGDKLVHLL